MTGWERSPGSGQPRAGLATPEDTEAVKRARPLERDLKMEAIVKRLEEIEASETPGSVRYAWKHWKESTRLLRMAIKRWIAVIPCRLHWHAPFPKKDPTQIYPQIKVCRRCGAWREQRYL